MNYRNHGSAKPRCREIALPRRHVIANRYCDSRRLNLDIEIRRSLACQLDYRPNRADYRRPLLRFDHGLAPRGRGNLPAIADLADSRCVRISAAWPNRDNRLPADDWSRVATCRCCRGCC